ncbi:uncharacterized protein KY384_001135 [Bacidia gigantensis]|uniref:uncharacterized protein n=1 Tax=Bacidia gigantensis TaxID=2732470 RepID=UPI001D054CDF|nr:uncharacterized protein KY384_001135 [Bacidia gigantensis]KAG8534291.1 hypothetical protein KY384_001135 [Bacidia gigantensis]
MRGKKTDIDASLTTGLRLWKRRKADTSPKPNDTVRKGSSLESDAISETSPPNGIGDRIIPQHKEPPENPHGRPSTGVGPALVQAPLQSDDAMTTQEQLNAGRGLAPADREIFVSSESSSPSNQTTITDAHLLAPIGASASQQPIGSDLTQNLRTQNLRTSFKMVLQLDNSNPVRGCKLDTGSKFNVISQRVVESVNLRTEPYNGPDCKPIGVEKIRPLGQVTFEWKVFEMPVIYCTTFVVLPAKVTESFDTLLGEDTIKEIGFFKENDNVYYLTRPGEERAFN